MHQMDNQREHFNTFLELCKQYPNATHSIRFFNMDDRYVNDSFVDGYGYVPCVSTECPNTIKRITGTYNVSLTKLTDNIVHMIDSVAVHEFFESIVENNYDCIRGEINFVNDSGIGNLYIQKWFTKDCLNS